MSRLSIVVPVYFNEDNLPDTIPRLLRLAEILADTELELIFVDDGSGDASLEILLRFQRLHPDRIKIVKLTRNFGSMSAILAGFSQATGDCVGMIAADLQDPPELFADMIEQWRRGTKAVFAVRTERDDNFSTRLWAGVYYALMRRFALPGYPRGGFDFLLVDRQVAREVIRIGEKNTNLMSLVYWLGFPHAVLPYTRRSREKGRSRWTLSKKIKLFIDSFVAFSYVPIRFVSATGVVIATSAFAYALYVLYAWRVTGIPVRGFAPLIITLALTAGVQMVMLGVLGEYLWRTLDETRRRPPFVIDEVIAGVREPSAPGASAETLAAQS